MLALLTIGLLALAVGPAAPADAAPRFVPWRGGETPALALKDLAGQPHDLADYRGQVVLVNFWATWCEPCREEMPSFLRLKERLAGRPLAILAVNYGEARDRVGDFLRRLGLELPVLLDPGQQATRAWRVRFLPTTFVVGAEGRLRYTVVGEVDWAADDAVDTVERLLP